jgi:hypothetical protein
VSHVEKLVRLYRKTERAKEVAEHNARAGSAGHEGAAGAGEEEDNLVELCRRHHRFVHERGFRIEQDRGRGRVRFTRPDGKVVPNAPRLDQLDAGEGWVALTQRHAQLGLRMDPRTANSKWTGEGMDYSLTVSNLFEFDRELLARAIRATFERRKTALPDGLPVALTAEFADDASKRTQWTAFVRKTGARDAADLPAAVAAIVRFIEQPLAAAAGRGGGPVRWPPGGPWG